MPICTLDAWLANKINISPTSPYFAQAIRDEQLKRIQQTLIHASANNKFYAQRLKKISLNNLTWAEFVKIDFTTSEDLQNYENLLCTSQNQVTRIVTLQTSGTTALPKRLAFNFQDLSETIDFFQVGMSQIIQSGQRLLVLWPGAMRPYGVSDLLREALTEQGIEVFSGQAQTTEQSLKAELEKHNPHVIVAAPRQLAILAKIYENGLVKNLVLNTVLSSAEYLSELLEDRLKKQGILTLDHYGITEACYGGGVECLHKNGFHLRELSIFIEIIHPKTLKLLPYGQEGEIVITTLNRKVMPLIRYRTGDVASLIEGPCACSSPLQRLGKVQGRIVYSQDGYSIEHCAKGGFYERTANLNLF